jgi:hypothetical protein
MRATPHVALPQLPPETSHGKVWFESHKPTQEAALWELLFRLKKKTRQGLALTSWSA